MNLENNHAHFKLSEFLNVQKETKNIVHQVSTKVELGMNFFEIEKLIENEFSIHGIEKNWHPIKVRIDQDTNLNFREKSNPEIKIRNGSIYFIDIGIVKNGYEGDAGDTYIFGDDIAERNSIITGCRDIFKATKDQWRLNNLTGKELYKFASIFANEKNLELNLNMDGHRLGTFPHGVFYKGSLIDVESTIKGGLWVLEIHVRCPDKRLSAFFEDLITL